MNKLVESSRTMFWLFSGIFLEEGGDNVLRSATQQNGRNDSKTGLAIKF